MRLVSLALMASLAVAPGCLAVPPLVGATGGALVAAVRNGGGDQDVSVAGHAVIGGLAGLVVDAIVIVTLIVTVDAIFAHPDLHDGCGGCH
jgi:hypothetical protein